MESINNFSNYLKNKIIEVTPYGTEQYVQSTNEFLDSNTLIAKATFLFLIILIFIFLFWLFSKIIFYLLSPSENPYIIKGMKDASEAMTIPQTLKSKSSIPIYRSKNQFHGVEFTYSFWMNIANITNDTANTFRHIFHKGNLNSYDPQKQDIFDPNNAPGVYLYTGKRSVAHNEELSKQFPVMGLLIRVNVFTNRDDDIAPNRYFEDITVDGIPIKKWVNVVIRSTSQNIVDIYINGVLTKRHKLRNVIKQNYDDIHINHNGGFLGHLSNLKYYNYAIGTFEIQQIVSNGPDLKIYKSNYLRTTKPFYLASNWYFDNNNILY